MPRNKFDVIIVGAGPSGCSAGIYLARKGYNVLILEKSRVPGHRNVSGGVIYGKYKKGYSLIDLLPDFEEEAPVERKIIDHSICILSDIKKSSGKYSLQYDGSYNYKKYVLNKNSISAKLGLLNVNPASGIDYSILKSKFDKWLSTKFIEVGGLLSTENSVEDLIINNNRIIGVKTTDEELYADVVIDASGVTSGLAEKAKLRSKLKSDQVYHGIKQVYQLSEEKIEERFNLKNGDGKAVFYLGNFMKGVSGGAFLYTNKDTISAGIVSSLDSLVDKCTNNPDELGKPIELLEAFQNHPELSQYLEGSTLLEYSAHNIPKGHKTMLKTPYTSGFLCIGDSLGSFVKIGALIDGIRRAIATGIMAGESFERAHKNNDFSAKGLSVYGKLLKPIYNDVFRSKIDSIFTENKLSYSTIPNLLFKYNLMTTSVSTNKSETNDDDDVIKKIQKRTGILDYSEDKDYSHIKVNYDSASKSINKPWVPLCPVNCYTFVSDKGVFASPKDLYNYNLEMSSNSINDDKASAKDLLKQTKSDIATSSLRFDHVACVACGTCGVIGPKGTIEFSDERRGHGVRYKYG